MKLYLLLPTCLLSLVVNAQSGRYDASQELRGSGRLVRETPAIEPFDALEIQQFPAKVTVDVGGTESSITIAVDDNLRPLLRVESGENTLKLAFRDPQNKPFWISKANVEVRLTTPVLKRLKHGSNSDVTVKGLRGESFALVNEANGNVTLNGRVNSLDVISSANGTVDAGELPVQSANIVTQANATVRVNARRVNLVRQAFANVVNVAGQTRPSADSQVGLTKSDQQLISLRFHNNSPLPRKVALVSYAPGDEGNETNGFTLAPYASREKQYAVGTAVYVATKQQIDVVMSGRRLRGKPFLTVAATDEGRTVQLAR